MNFLNRCAVRANAGGLSDFVMVNAIPGFYTPPLCQNPSVVDGSEYNYFAISDDGTQHEEGIGTWDAAANTLYRSSVGAPRNSSNGGDYVSFSAAPIVYMGGPVAEDILSRDILPTEAGYGSNLVTNGSFNGDASGWTLTGGWAYDTNKITYTADGNFREATQAIASINSGTTYHVSVDIVGYVAGVLGALVGGTSADFSVSGDGTYTVEVTASNTGELWVFANSADFAGSVTNIQLKEKFPSNIYTLHHEDGSDALIVNTSASGSGAAPTMNVAPNNRLGFDSTHLIQRKTDGSVGVDLSVNSLTADRNFIWPNLDGVISTSVAGGWAVSELPADPSASLVWSGFVWDSSVPYTGANIGSVVVGGGSEYVRVYYDWNSSQWKIG